MKKFLMLLISCFVSQSAFAVDRGPVVPMKILTIALNKTTHSEFASHSTPYSHDIANKFYETMKSEIKNKGYTGTVTTRLKKEDEEATSSFFKSSQTDNYNFIFSVGHGMPYRLIQYDKTSVFIEDKQFGGNTYWVWLYSCLVFKNTYDGDSRFNSAFNNGVHSILGFATNVTAESASIKVPKEFAIQWVRNGKSIWNAFKLAVQYRLHDTGNTTMKPQGDGTSISTTNVPAIAYRWGFVNNTATELANEKFETAYKGPVLNSSTYNNDPSHFCVKKQVYTRPTY